MNTMTNSVESTISIHSITHPKMEWEHITPLMADKFLWHRGFTRNVRPRLVSRYSQLMKEGNWIQFHPQPIVFDSGGNLIDGQHRLSAITRSGKSAWCLVIRYSEKDPLVRLTIDRGAPRTVANVISSYCEKSVSPKYAATLRSFLIGASSSNLAFSDLELVRGWRRYGEKCELVSSWFTKNEQGINRAPVIGACVRALADVSEEDMKRYVYVLQTGASETKAETTIITLREWLKKHLETRAGGWQLSRSIYLRTERNIYAYSNGEVMVRATEAPHELYPLEETE